MAITQELVLILFATAFLPPLLYMIIIRSAERRGREPWSRLLFVFFYGALISVVFALILEAVFHTGFQREYNLEVDSVELALMLAVVIAPVVEELTKGLAIRGARSKITELEDGIVYGATAGLGFSATENVIYEYVALTEQGVASFVGVAFLRSITSTFLHATASGMLGYGLARVYVEKRWAIEVIPFYAMAVLLHAVFNLIASFEFLGGFFLILLVSFAGIRWVLQRIRELDRTSIPTFRRLG